MTLSTRSQHNKSQELLKFRTAGCSLNDERAEDGHSERLIVIASLYESSQILFRFTVIVDKNALL